MLSCQTAQIFAHFHSKRAHFRIFSNIFECFRIFSNVFERFCLAYLTQTMQTNPLGTVFTPKTNIHLEKNLKILISLLFLNFYLLFLSLIFDFFSAFSAVNSFFFATSCLCG